MLVKILVTGGTFDKEYDLINGDLHFTETHIPGILELGRCTVDYSIRTLMMVDSLEMSETDRDVIKRNCEMAKEENILITHGTDTITETGRYLASFDLNKTMTTLRPQGKKVITNYKTPEPKFDLNVGEDEFDVE